MLLLTRFCSNEIRKTRSALLHTEGDEDEVAQNTLGVEGQLFDFERDLDSHVEFIECSAVEGNMDALETFILA